MIMKTFGVTVNVSFYLLSAPGIFLEFISKNAEEVAFGHCFE